MKIVTPITITNNQSVPTPAPFQQMIQTPITYRNGVRFWSPADGALHAWLESISNGTATIWVNIPSSIPAGGTYQLYMTQDFDLSMDGIYWGEAPQLSSTYAQYDNGPLVFNYYTNFVGTSLPSGWTSVVQNSPGSVTVNNGVKIVGGTCRCFAFNGIFFSDTYLPSPPFAVDYAPQQTTSPSGGWPAENWAGFTNSTTKYATAPGNKFLLLQFGAGQNAGVGGTFGGSATQGNLATPPGNTFVGVFTQLVTSTSYYTYYNYTQSTGYITGMSNFSTAGMYWTFEISGQEGNYAPNGETINWFRIRACPPGGVMPAVSLGTPQYLGDLIMATVPTVTSQATTEFTLLPYTAPGNGKIVLQLEGSGSVATVSLNGGSTTYDLNSGNALVSGSIYEFSVEVASGDVLTVSGATFIRGFFIPEVTG
jgi:hypothetical protein